MTADGRPGDGPVGSQIDHPHRAARDRDEQIPADRVGECGEGVHARMVTDALPIGQRTVDPGRSTKAAPVTERSDGVMAILDLSGSTADSTRR